MWVEFFNRDVAVSIVILGKKQHSLMFQLADTVPLFGTLLLLDPIHFPESEPCLIIGSVC